MLQQAHNRRLFVYRATPAVCVCLELRDKAQVSDNGFFFFLPFLFKLLHICSYSADVFVQLGLLSMQNVGSDLCHYTKTHYDVLECLHSLLDSVDRKHSTTRTMNLNRRGLNPGHTQVTWT